MGDFSDVKPTGCSDRPDAWELEVNKRGNYYAQVSRYNYRILKLVSDELGIYYSTLLVSYF